MLLNSKDLVLLIVDIQTKLITKISDYEEVIKASEDILKVFSILKLPVIFSEQYPKGLGPTIPSLSKLLKEIKSTEISKTTFSCLAPFSKTQIKKKFPKRQVLLCGIEAHICVLQTAIDFIKHGYEVFLIEEAIGSRNHKHKYEGIERMKKSGASLVNIEMILFELTRDSLHKNFKDISKYIAK